MNRRQPIGAGVHRFRDAVAVHLGTGETVYLTPREARQFTRALNRVARSCDRETFTESAGLTETFVFGEAG